MSNDISFQSFPIHRYFEWYLKNKNLSFIEFLKELLRKPVSPISEILGDEKM